VNVFEGRVGGNLEVGRVGRRILGASAWAARKRGIGVEGRVHWEKRVAKVGQGGRQWGELDRNGPAVAISIERSKGTKKDEGACREKSKRPRPPMDTGRWAIHQAGEDGVRSSWESAWVRWERKVWVVC
jgi:hypothetical protein